VDALLEKGDEGLILTGNKTKVLRLAGLQTGVPGDVIVSGLWHSTDQVRVSISSALVAPNKVARVVKALIDEEPMFVWLPEYSKNDDGEEYLQNERPNCVPWIVNPSSDARLDDGDPLGSIWAQKRPGIADSLASQCGIRSVDPFGRLWLSPRGRIVARSQAWGHDIKHDEEQNLSGVRLVCSQTLLKHLLTRINLDLLILIDLERYEKGQDSHSDGKFRKTIAVIRVTKSLDVKYYKGRSNHLRSPRD